MSDSYDMRDLSRNKKKMNIYCQIHGHPIFQDEKRPERLSTSQRTSVVVREGNTR